MAYLADSSLSFNQFSRDFSKSFVVTALSNTLIYLNFELDSPAHANSAVCGLIFVTEGAAPPDWIGIYKALAVNQASASAYAS